MAHGRTRARDVFRRHSLSLAVGAIVALWFVLHVRGDPSTHLGAFYGNAVADWFGTFLIVIATKYFYEIGSAESKQPHPKSRGAFPRFVVDHSLTIVLVATGIAWAVGYARMDPNGKAGQVVGNIVSEWTQVLGLVVITKYTREIGSKESVTSHNGGQGAGMGDKGGKKDKEKRKQQQVTKEKQEAQQKQDKARPRTP